LGNYLRHLEGLVDANPVAWKAYQWEVYRGLAEYYSQEDDNELVIRYGEKAAENNDTLDLSLLLARAYQKLSQNTSAIGILVANIDSTDLVWQLNQKGELLLELGDSRKAIEAFTLASRKNEGAENAGELGKAMVNNGLINEARSYFLKDAQTAGDWNADEKIATLFEFDLKYGTADSAQINYRKLTDINFLNDPVGIYRLRLFAKSPLSPWSLGDVGRLLLLAVVVLVLFIIPYLWVLPIHYYGFIRKEKGISFSGATFSWTLKHFWLVCSIWFLSDFLAFAVFDYQGFIALVNNNFIADDMPGISREVALMDIFFCTGLLVMSIALLKTEDFETFLAKLKANVSSIGVGIGLALVLRLGLILYVSTFSKLGIDFTTDASFITSINETIISINKYYNPMLGFLFVVIFAPFYEEIIFRGVFLSACGRNMKFVFANILQAFVFAAVHQNLKFFAFYFAFGMMAGYYTRKSGSLITSTSMHMMNNAMAFVYILYLKP
jgi:uncharacterized protein